MEFKTLRMNFLNVILSILIIPMSFLVINIANNANIIILLLGLIVSSLMGNFLVSYSQRITNIVSIQVLELYSTWGISTQILALSIGIYHVIVSIPIIVVVTLILLMIGTNINWLYYLIGICMTIIFMGTFGGVIGTNIKKPNKALAVNSYMYYLLTMITPIYYETVNNYRVYNIVNILNPISHLVNILRYSVGLYENISFISYIYILFLIMILYIITKNRLSKVYMVESYI